jgi:hypothetical protein
VKAELKFACPVTIAEKTRSCLDAADEKTNNSTERKIEMKNRHEINKVSLFAFVCP